MSERVRIAIVGAGPAGLSCAAHAAELGVSHLLLEAETRCANTIYRYQKGKFVMAEPAVLPLRSAMPFTAGRREEVLQDWEQAIARCGARVRLSTPVTALRGQKGAFELISASGEIFCAEHVVLCIGVQGNPNRLDVPGADHPRVQYTLDDPQAYEGETIAVIGAGDAAIENALALAQANRVVLVNRGEEFPRAKQANLESVLAAIRDGRIECRYGARCERVDAQQGGEKPLALVLQTPGGSEILACDRIIARLGATPPRALVERFGVRFPNARPDAVAGVSNTYESNVPGLYIIGSLAGYPLIKQCLNQGYEVVEYIEGRELKPADEPLLKKKLASFPRDGGVSRALALIQRNVPLFAELTTLQLREFLLESEVRAFRPGEIVFRRGDYTNSFFSVLEGSVRVEVGAADGGAGEITLGRGEFFGEIGLLSGRRRSSTVRAGDRCILIETPRRAMLRLMSANEGVRRRVDEVSLRRAVRASVSPSLPEAFLDEIVKEARVCRFAAGETLFNQGDPADGLHLIRRGSVMVSCVIGGREVVLTYVPAGRYIGEMALLSAEPRSATVRAAVATETIMLPAQAFRHALDRDPALRAHIQATALERVRANERRISAPETGNLVRFLMNQGLGEATDVLLIDENLCVRCDACEKACSDTHEGISRLNRQAGPTFAQIHVPTSCRHCENPHCMKDCPPDAIHRRPNGEVVIEDTCIGCGNCQHNCPYGVIQMGPARPRGARPSLLAWLLFGLGPEPGGRSEIQAMDQPKKAVKCDMCVGLPGGPACVRACPTGAAIRVSPEEFVSYLGRE